MSDLGQFSAGSDGIRDEEATASSQMKKKNTVKQQVVFIPPLARKSLNALSHLENGSFYDPLKIADDQLLTIERPESQNFWKARIASEGRSLPALINNANPRFNPPHFFAKGHTYSTDITPKGIVGQGI